MGTIAEIWGNFKLMALDKTNLMIHTTDKMLKRSSKRQTLGDNELADLVTNQATSEPATEPSKKNPAAVALGRLGGRKGGLARASKLTAIERSEIARKAALTRWYRRK